MKNRVHNIKSDSYYSVIQYGDKSERKHYSLITSVLKEEMPDFPLSSPAFRYYRTCIDIFIGQANRTIWRQLPNKNTHQTLRD